MKSLTSILIQLNEQLPPAGGKNHYFLVRQGSSHPEINFWVGEDLHGCTIEDPADLEDPATLLNNIVTYAKSLTQVASQEVPEVHE